MNLPAPRHSVADRYPSPSQPVTTQTTHPVAVAGAGEPGDRRYADGLATWPRARSRLEQFHAAARARRSSRDADLADRVAQRSSQVNWTMIVSSRGRQAPLGVAEQPATLSTNIPRGRWCAHQATPSGSR